MKSIFFFTVFFLGVIQLMGQDVTGDWYGVLEVSGVKLRLVFHISEENGQYKATMDSPDQGATGFPAASVDFTGQELDLQFPSLQAGYKAKYENEELTGTFTQMGMSFPLNMGRHERKPARPQEPKPPFPYRDEDIIFQNSRAGIKLAGTLTLPQGKGPFPAVVLISGSGPQNRDEELMGHKPFWVLADYLARRGIAVLRFDDRGVGRSEGVFAQATTFDFASDAQAAVNYLRGRRDIRQSAIGLVGHSEGGIIAPILASQDRDIAFIVLMAGPGATGKEVLLQQGREMMERQGEQQEEIEKHLIFNRKIYEIVDSVPMDHLHEVSPDLIKKGLESLESEVGTVPKKLKESLSPQVVATLTTPWYKVFLAFDPREYLTAVKCPVLAINGEKDFQVNARINLPLIYRYLTEGGNTAVDTVYFSGLNHLFQECRTGLLDEYASIEQTLSPAALETIGDWIEKKVKTE